MEPVVLAQHMSLAMDQGSITVLRNMFLAADYVRTDTNLACMEGANEAARLAVNEILQFVESPAASSKPASPCCRPAAPRVR